MKRQSTGRQFIQALESIPYPSHPLLKYLFKLPILLWRLGLGFIVGRLFMIMTTTGRKTGLPRRTAIEYHTFKGRKHVMAAWPNSDWYQNLLANPHLTIQTVSGTEHVVAKRLTSDEELAKVYQFVEQNPMMRRFWQALGFRLSLDEFLTQKDQFHLLAFDPTSELTPPPLEADLKWIWLIVLIVGSFVYRIIR